MDSLCRGGRFNWAHGIGFSEWVRKLVLTSLLALGSGQESWCLHLCWHSAVGHDQGQGLAIMWACCGRLLLHILVEVQQLWDIRQFVWNRHMRGSRGVPLWRKTTGALEKKDVGRSTERETPCSLRESTDAV
jgi:hypothetical protein